MSIWHELIKGLTTMAFDRMMRPKDSLAAIDRLAAQSDWSVHERINDTAVLHFIDPIVGNRKLYVRPVENGMGVFTSPSLMVFASIPQVVTEYLLARNAQLVVGTWTTHVVEGGTLVLLAHRTILDTMTAVRFRYTCEEMTREAQYVDGQLQKAGIGA